MSSRSAVSSGPAPLRTALGAALILAGAIGGTPAHAQLDDDGFVAKKPNAQAPAPTTPAPATPALTPPEPDATSTPAPSDGVNAPVPPPATPPAPAPNSDIMDPGAPRAPGAVETQPPPTPSQPAPRTVAPSPAPGTDPENLMDTGCVASAFCWRPAGTLHDALSVGRVLGIWAVATCLPLGGIWGPVLLAKRLPPLNGGVVRTVILNTAVPPVLAAMGPAVGVLAWVVVGLISGVSLAALYGVVFGAFGTLVLPAGGTLVGVGAAAFGLVLGFVGGGSGVGAACCLLCGMPGLVLGLMWQLYVLPLTTVRAWNAAAHQAQPEASAEEPR